MPSPFPGMDPYLERSGLWPGVHHGLIHGMQVALTRAVAPRYVVAVEERVYMAAPEPDPYVGRPDVVVAGPAQPMVAEALPQSATLSRPMVVELPHIEDVHERYLEIRTAGDERVITVIELLSPTNKLPGKGRTLYLDKREDLLASWTGLVEIDLLRSGAPMPMRNVPPVDYRILVSRPWERPRAHLHAFGVREPIPVIPVPLQRGEDEPPLDLGALLATVYDEARYDLRVDYTAPPDPPLAAADAAWAAEVIAGV